MKKFWFWLLLGNLFCGFYVAAPWIWSYRHTPSDQVMLPLHDQLHMCGDSSFYAAGVQQTRETPFRFQNPASKEIGTYWFNIFTEGSRIIAASLGFFLANERLAFVLSFSFCLLLNFTLLFAMGASAGLPPVFCAALGVFVPFWIDILLPGTGLQAKLHIFLDSSVFFPFDAVSDSFRYVILQSAAVLAWLSCLFCLRFRKWNFTTSGLFVVLAILLPYSYLPITLSGAALVFLCCAPASLSTLGQFKKVLPALVLIVLGLLLIGFPAHVDHWLHANSNVISQAHLNVHAFGFFEHLPIVLRYSIHILLPVLLPWVLLKRRDPFRRLLGAMCLLSIGVCLGLFVPSLFSPASRLFARGISSFWTAVVFIAWAKVLLLALSHVQKRSVLIWKGAWLAIGAGLFLMVAIPAFHTLRISRAFLQNGVYFLPREDWDAFQYIRDSLPPHANVLVLDLTAIQLLPVYTHANPFFVDPTLSGKSPEEGLERYIDGWKLIGADLSILDDWIANRFPDMEFTCSVNPRNAALRSVAEPTMTLKSVFYDPTLITLYGIPIRSETNYHRVNPAFLSKIRELIKKPLDADLRKKQVEYILLSDLYEKARPTPRGPIAGYQLIFKNGARTLYQRTGN